MFRLLSQGDLEQAQKAISQSAILSGVSRGTDLEDRFAETVARYGGIAEFAEGDVLVQENQYGNVLYIVLEGDVREVVEDPEGIVARELPEPAHAVPARRSMRDLWRRRREEEVLVVDAYLRRTLPDVRRVLHDCETAALRPRLPKADVVVGESAVLTRGPHYRTAFAETPVRALSIHWRGMRDLMTACPALRDVMTAHCRIGSLQAIRSGLLGFPFLRALPADLFDPLAEQADFRFSGTPSSEITAVDEGDPVNEVLVTISGFGQVSRIRDGERCGVGFVRSGNVLGLAALKARGAGAASRSVVELLGETSLLALPAGYVAEKILPSLSVDEVSALDPTAGIELYGLVPEESKTLQDLSREARMIDFLVEHDFYRGREAMVIDQTRCVGCDECVRSCAATHGGVPRFVRSGPAEAGYAVANACMHCQEPPCLVNCPTNAIFQKPGGEVVVSEPLCIGCGTCAVACPYDNIRLVQVGDGFERVERSTPVAAKCDLCIGRPSGPACVRACPYDAIARVDLTAHSSVSRLAAGASMAELGGGPRDPNQRPGPAARGERPPASRSPGSAAGWLLLPAAALSIGWAAHGVVDATLRPMPYWTGWTLAAGLALLGLHRFVRAHLWPAAAALRMHMHLGWLAILLFWVHAGGLPGTGFGRLLWVSSVLAFGSGVLGLGISRLAPRRYGEWDLLPYGRIGERRGELAERADAVFHGLMRDGCPPLLVRHYARRLLPFFSRPAHLLQHWAGSSRPLDQLLLETDYAGRELEDDDGFRALRALIAEKDRLDRRWALYWLNRGWLFVHLPAAAVTAVLIVGHIVFVHAYGG